ncbi:MAG: PQQ-binding-like beta-propeller repeat protein [Planctomycetota bacterium]|nr:PQQ-binding-like beta-propeller repeat protein [Planctomycetota bacterium]MDA0919292.1 PQQ-binding-like beta-propeller repeat protein [Planctomycetota bacterium]
MFSIGRIPVLKFQRLSCCALRLISALCLVAAWGLVANAQTSEPKRDDAVVPEPPSAPAPRSIEVPLANLRRASRAIDTRWIAPPGHVTDRQLVMRLTKFQEAARGPWADDFNWNEVLENVQKGILAMPEDTLIMPVPIDYAEDEQQLPYGFTPPPLHSLKKVTEEIIADLPPDGRGAWLRLVADRANADFNEAVRLGDWAAINRVASQDVHTPAGYSAIELLGNRHLDQNHPMAALRQFYRLFQTDQARESREPSLSIRIAIAWSSLGQPGQARLSLYELSKWLEKHPNVAASLPKDFVSETAAWIQKTSVVTVDSSSPDHGSRFSSAGRLPVALESAFSPDARVTWTSGTSGFKVAFTDADRKKFAANFDEDDVNAEDPYPESEAEVAALVDVGLAHLARRDHRRKTKALPACDPVVADRQVVFRTLDRIRSVDLATGKLRWESFMEDPAFAEQFDLSRALQSVNVPQESHDISNPLNQRQSAVVYTKSRLDRTTGTLSTNGKVLFALEDGGVTSKATSYRQPGLRQTAPKSWNRLCAIDLESGILKWQIGGPEGEHELPASGTFFLGVPTVVGDSAYVLGERSNGVRLLCLESASGRIKWVQPVATVNSGVTQEGLRRVGGISPCSADGLIICPTIAGLVVAFDPEQQRLAWTSVYRTTMLTRPVPRSIFQMPTRVNADDVESSDRWRHDSVIVRAGRVVMSPLDSQQLICLDAVSGDTLWTQPRDRGLFIGATIDHQIIVVDDSAVRSLNLDDGELHWIVRLNQRTPTGRGLQVGSLFHLPVATLVDDESSEDEWPLAGNSTDKPLDKTGRLITIDLKAGRLLAESATPDGQPLGNLVGHEGQLVTQRFDSVVALEPLFEVETSLARQLEQNPDDSSALESRARIRLHEGKLDEGLRDLQLAVQDKAARSALNLLFEQALEQLRQGQELDETTKQVLAKADLNAVQRNSLDAVRFQSLLTSGRYVAAFDLMLESPRTDPATGQPFIVHADPLAISSPAWIAAQLQAAYEKVVSQSPDQANVEALDQRILARLNQAKSETEPAALRVWLELFSWHKLFAAGAVALVERLDAKQDALEIESLLLSLSQDADRGVAMAAKDRLPRPSVAADWPDNAPLITTATHNLSANRRILVDVLGSRSPVIRGWEFELTLDGLTALSPTGNPLWTLTDKQLGSDPLLTTSRHGSCRIMSSGHLLAVSTGTEFSVFDIQEAQPRRLWMRAFLSHEAEGFLQMRQTHLLGSPVLISGSTPVGSVDFLNSRSLVFRTGSTLRVASATNGETSWTRENIPPDAIVFGDESALSVVHVGSGHCQLFDLRTGRLIREHLDIPLVGLLTTYGTDLILRQNRGTTHTISRVAMRTGKAAWEYEFPNKGSIRPADEDRLIEFHPDGRILVHEQSTGEVIIDVQAEAQLIPGRFFLHETPTEYVLFSATPQRGFQSRIGPLSQQGTGQDKVEGPAYGIDRRTGKLIWSVNIEPQYLAGKQPSQLPFVVLACWSSPDRPDGQFSRSGRHFPLRVLDTRTGQTIFSSDDAGDGEMVLNYLSTGDAPQKQASITFAKTVIQLDYSAKPPAAVSPKD